MDCPKQSKRQKACAAPGIKNPGSSGDGERMIEEILVERPPVTFSLKRKIIESGDSCRNKSPLLLRSSLRSAHIPFSLSYLLRWGDCEKPRLSGALL
jgi:hypothetical protein